MGEERFVEDIGMFCLDRPMSSCKHATDFCRKHCYNLKFYKMFDLSDKDKRLASFWKELDGSQLNRILSRKRRDTSRFRLMSRGEAFKTEDDVNKVVDFAEKNPDTVFWIPTRAWRSARLRSLIEDGLMGRENVRILASTDPTTSEEEQEMLERRGWSTMFFGDNSATEGRVKCPKTWEGKKGYCIGCEKGCFSKGRVDVHMKQH